MSSLQQFPHHRDVAADAPHRTKLIKPTSSMGIGRRELEAVNWSHPAYANRHIVARNDEEILRASLERE